jgi:bilirubin oxidase
MQADQQNNASVPFTVIGSDSGLSLKPVVSDTVTISIAERWEVVVDFTAYAGQNVTMHNQRNVGVDNDYAGTDRVMSKLHFVYLR